MARVGGKVTKRGEVWIVDLRLSGSIEISKVRPALVISTTLVNRLSPRVIVVPFSTRIPKNFSREAVFVGKRESGLSQDSILIALQLRAVDRGSLLKKVGRLSPDKMSEVEESVKLILGLSDSN